MRPGTAYSCGRRSPQASAGARNNMREPARSGKKPPTKNGWGFTIVGAEASARGLSRLQ